MAENNFEKTLAVIQAIRAQDADGALEYVDPSFVQHYPHMAAGTEGLRRYVTESAPGEVKMSVVRAIEDGPYVVTQLKLESSGETMFAVYRFVNGLIAEHWAFTSADAPPNKSGHTQLDGPLKPQHLEDTERNRRSCAATMKPFTWQADVTRTTTSSPGT